MNALIHAVCDFDWNDFSHSFPTASRQRPDR